jgi:hypothetical protein
MAHIAFSVIATFVVITVVASPSVIFMSASMLALTGVF